MTIEHNGVEYWTQIGSDIIRDGMYLEVGSGPDKTGEILEVFYSDVTNEMSLTLHVPDVPLAVVESALAVARARLPPRAGAVIRAGPAS